MKTIHERLLEFERQNGRYWEPAPLLARLASEGATFAAFDASRSG